MSQGQAQVAPRVLRMMTVAAHNNTRSSSNTCTAGIARVALRTPSVQRKEAGHDDDVQKTLSILP